MNLKKILVGSLIVPTLIINFSQVSAEEVEIFGSEFEDDSNTQVEVEVEIENPEPEKPPEVKVTPPEVEVSTPTETNQPEVKVTPPEIKVSTPTETNLPEVEVSTPTETNLPEEEENLGDTLTFDDLTKNRSGNSEITSPIENNFDNNEDIVYTPPQTTKNPLTTVKQPSTAAKEETKQKNLKMQKSRFAKLTMDETYVYYLDRESVSWKRLPYSSSEMMADVWIRMIERDDDDLLSEDEVDEIVYAKEEGKQFRPEDVEVLKHGRYHMEHYYLRPKTEQIQFLCELSDIEGRPQNTISERAYNYANWEYLVPSSVESRIYRSVIKIIGKRSLDDPVTFADYVEEYARISIR